MPFSVFISYSHRDRALREEDALSIGENMYGRDHPDTCYLLHNLAVLYKSRDKDDEAERLYQRALAIKEKAFGPDYPYTKRVQEDYRDLLQKMGQKTEGGDQQN